ncbi:kinase-like domain-containing protein [Pestalotiopsis sp. NC0098]|nr:kinase-like domain-containing protein [Pestalotiopsis sp. NC0098]
MNKSSLRFWGFAPSGLQGVNVVDWLDERRYAQYPTPSDDPSTDSPAQSLLRKWLHEDGLDLDTPERLIFKVPDHQEIDLQDLEAFLETKLQPGSFTVNIFQDLLFLESSTSLLDSDIRDMASMSSVSRRIRRRYHWIKRYNKSLLASSPQNPATEENDMNETKHSNIGILQFDDLRLGHRLGSSSLTLLHGTWDPQAQAEPVVSNATITGYHKTCSIFKSSITSSAKRSGGSQVELVAVKKFSSRKKSNHSRDSGDFDDFRDFDGIEERLRAVNQLRHPNLVETIAVFRSRESDDSEEIFWNVVSPLAACDLEQLFHYQLRDGPVVPCTQLEALTSAVAYLHETLRIAHRSIRPSNILVYQPQGSPELVLKLAGFSSAGVKGLQPPVPAQWMEVHEDLLDQDVREDIMALGCVFVELVAFMTKGRRAVVDLRRSITSSQGNISTDGFYDGYKISRKLDVKQEVFDWIFKSLQMSNSELKRGLSKSSEDDWVPRVLLLVRRMLRIDPLERGSAREVCEMLQHAVDHDILDTPYRFTDGHRIFRFTVASKSEQPRWHDKLRIRLERQLGSAFDWSPLPDITYPCREGEMTVTWKYGNRDISKVISSIKAKVLMNSFGRVFSNGTPLLPIAEFGKRDKQSGPSSVKQPYDSTGHRSKLSSEFQSGGGTILGTNRTGKTISNPSDNGWTKEIYMCVDRVLVEIQQTTLCPITRVNALSDDKALLCKMREQLHDCNGRFKNLISWKTCTEVKFITFKIARDRDVVPMDFKLPEQPHDYEYKYPRRPEYIKAYLETVVARNILCGIHDTAAGAGETDLIDHILKKRVPHQLNTSAAAYGLRAMQGLSLKKICWWMAVSYILGLAFIIFWLSFVDKLDLQNAFMPVTVLATMLVGALATTQVLV